MNPLLELVDKGFDLSIVGDDGIDFLQRYGEKRRSSMLNTGRYSQAQLSIRYF